MATDDDSEREPEWAKHLGHLLWETWMHVSGMAEENLSGSPLTSSSLGLMDAVTTWPGITVAELSRRSTRTQQATSQVVARLEKLGLVERRLRAGRGVSLYATPAGEAAHREASAREIELEQHLEDVLGAKLYSQLRQGLATARDRLAADTFARASNR